MNKIIVDLDILKKGLHKCNKCNQIKAISDFPKNKNNKLGIENICKECKKQQYKNRRIKFNNKCIDCKKIICQEAIRCKECDNLNRKITYLGVNNPAYIDGRTLIDYFCLICGKKLNYYRTKTNMCQSCENKERLKDPKNHPNYKDGRSLKVIKCMDCKKILNDYRAKRCYDCDVKRRMNNKQGVFGINYKTLPEIKVETILNELKLNFKYVGDRTIWIDKFNPDFIDKERKLIIEVFGDYWHNRPKTKEKDKYRKITYSKYGYKTLIIWENELKNINKVKEKIMELNNG